MPDTKVLSLSLPIAIPANAALYPKPANSTEHLSYLAQTLIT